MHYIIDTGMKEHLDTWVYTYTSRLGMRVKFGRSFGLTTCGRPQLKLILL